MTNTFSVIKCPIQLVVKNQSIRDAIEKRVQFQSRVVHRGSHVVLLTAIYCYHHDIAFPDIKLGTHASKFINHCFNPYPTWNNKDNCWVSDQIPGPILDAVESELHWPQYTTVSNIPGYSRNYQLSADKYATNLHNHVIMNIWTFIRHTVQTFCRLHNYPSSKNHPLVLDIIDAIKDPAHICTIDDYKNPEQMIVNIDTDARVEFIKYHREYLQENKIQNLTKRLFLCSGRPYTRYSPA